MLPTARSTSWMYSLSSMLSPGYNAENVYSPSVCRSVPVDIRRAIVDATPLESSPPDSGTPTGTSEMRWRATHLVPARRELLRVVVVAATRRELGIHRRVPVALDLHDAVGPHEHRVRGQQTLHAVEEGVLAVVVQAEQQEAAERRRRSGRRGTRGSWNSAFSSDANANAAGRVDVVQRLDAEPVAGEEQLAALVVGDREREHAGEMVDDVAAPLLEAAQDDLGVGVVGDEAPALAFELARAAPRGCRSRR